MAIDIQGLQAEFNKYTPEQVRSAWDIFKEGQVRRKPEPGYEASTGDGLVSNGQPVPGITIQPRGKRAGDPGEEFYSFRVTRVTGETHIWYTWDEEVLGERNFLHFVLGVGNTCVQKWPYERFCREFTHERFCR